MVTKRSKYVRVADLMNQRQIGLDALADSSGVERRVVEAIACQRYTPSPEQRARVSRKLGVDRERIVWGHVALVEEHASGPI